MKSTWRLLAAAITLGAATATLAATPDLLDTADQYAAQLEPQIWRVDGGDMRVRFNESFLDLFGMGVKLTAGVKDTANVEYAIFPVLATGGLTMNAPDGSFERFIDGTLKLRGGFELSLPDGTRLDLRDAVVQPRVENPRQLQLVGKDGQAWLYVNHLMYEFVNDYRTFNVRTADLRVSPALAKRLNQPALIDAYIGELHMDIGVRERSREMTARPKGNTPNFHGTPHPSGGTYQADVLLQTYSMSFMRCRRENGTTNGCDGAGADDGQVVFTPSAELRNTNDTRTADIPWYQKFTGNTNPWGYPYPNADQHPYLIWNVYRVVDDQLEQIGGSGVKHAFLTTNTGCSNQFGNHILSPNCSDIYGTGNNDNISDLGPRSEILPATGQWGRCGSVFDTDCNGSPNGVGSCSGAGNGCYNQRLVIRESQMLVPQATFWSESWYIIQDDINIYNTMGRRTMAPAPGGGGWVVGSQGTFARGPVIDAWVDPVANPTRNIELKSGFGRSRVAVKVKTLSSCPAESGLAGTCYRYDYAVSNFDYAVATTSGTPPNLRVTDGKGFSRFSIQRPAATGIHLPVGAHFADTDIDSANNWTGSITGDSIEWTAPAGNELNWGTLYRFSFISDSAPASTAQTRITLTPANLFEGVTPLTENMVGPMSFGARVMANGFEAN